MTAPSTPTLTVTPLSSSSFQAVIGSDPGVTNTIYTQIIDFPGELTLPYTPTLVGPGTIVVVGIEASSHLLVTVISNNGTNSLPATAFISLIFPSTLLEAIKTKWYNTPSLTSLITGGLFLSQMPDTTGVQRLDPPYSTCDQERTRFEWTETKLFYEISTIGFHYYSPGSANNLEQMTAEIRSAFDWKSVTFTDASVSSAYIQPLEYYLSAEPLRWRDDTLMYSGCIRYEFWINRTFSPYR